MLTSKRSNSCRGTLTAKAICKFYMNILSFLSLSCLMVMDNPRETINLDLPLTYGNMFTLMNCRFSAGKHVMCDC